MIIYFIINGVIAKNNLFNHHIAAGEQGEKQRGPEEAGPKGKKGGRLKVVK